MCMLIAQGVHIGIWIAVNVPMQITENNVKNIFKRRNSHNQKLDIAFLTTGAA